jgi:hypothetical protein
MNTRSFSLALAIFLPLACFGQSGRPNFIPQPSPNSSASYIHFTGVTITAPSYVTNSLTFTLNAVVSPITSYRWLWAPSGNPPFGGMTLTTPTSTNTSVTVLGPGNYDFVGTARAGLRFAEVTVSVAVNVTSNAPPTISTIANVSTNEDFSTLVIPFTVGDDQTPPGSLIVLAASSNPSVLPNTGITLGGSGANRTIKLTPLPNSNGVATVTVSVTDGSASPATTMASFQATWLGVNDPPTFTLIPVSVSGNEDGGAIAFTHGVTDVETDPSILVETAIADNPALVSSVVVTGGGTAFRTVTINLVTNAFGSANIDLALQDGSTTSHRIVPLTVFGVNDPPAMSAISDLIATNGVSVQVAFTISDVEDGTALSLSKASTVPAVIPTANIVFGGSGGSRTATLTPTGVGSTTVTLTATDSSSATAARSFVVTVSAVPNTPPTITAPANQTTSEDVPQSGLVVTIGDNETAAASLVLSAVSSNPALTPTITLGGSGASRTLSYTLATNASGSATFVLTVSDGSASTQASFSVTASAVNDRPVWGSQITQKTVQVGTPLLVSNSVSDPETAAGSLTVTASVTSGSGVSVSSPVNSSGTVTFTLTGSAASTNTVEVVVSDGALTATNSFTVLVTAAPNANPTITGLVNRTIAQGAVDNQTVTVGDAESGAAAVTLSAQSADSTLLPTNNIVFGGSGATRTIQLTPVSSQSGSVLVTIVAKDTQGGSASQSYTLTVTPTGGATFFAAPEGVGSSSNPGTESSPWNIGSILNRTTKNLQSGTTVILLPGTYPVVGNNVFRFSNYDQAGYITIKGKNRVWGPNSGATIFDGNNATRGDGVIDGTLGSANRIRFQDLVGINTALRQAYPSDNTDRRNFVYWTARGYVQFVNCWSQDSGNGFGFEDDSSIPSGNALFYGNISCLNGSPGADDVHHGHNWYIQCKNSQYRVTFQNNVSHNACGQGWQVRGGDEALEFYNTILYGNVFYNNGYGGMDVQNGVLKAPSPTRNFYFGGGERATNYVVVSNFTYYALPAGGPSTFLQNPSTVACNVGSGNYGPHPNYNTNLFVVGNVNWGGEFLWGRWVNSVITNNIFVGGTRQSLVWQDRFTSGGCPLLTWSEPFDTGALGSVEDRNFIYGSNPYNSTKFGNMSLAQWQANTPFGDNDTYMGTGAPTTNIVTLFPNDYDSKLALLVVYNPSGASTVTVNLGGFLVNGDSFDVYSTTSRTSRHSSGQYQGSAVIPMVGMPLTAMTGYVSGPNLGAMKSPEPYFGCFQILKTN